MRDFDIDSDLKQEKFQNIKLVQGDRGNKIKINVYEDGQPVNLAGCSVTAKYKRADGEIINDGVIENIHDNSFDAVMDSSITKVAGTLKMLFTIEKDDVKVSTFLLLADVRESIGENTGSSGGNTGGGSGEVTIDLSNYYKKIETYSKNQIDARFKDIVNFKINYCNPMNFGAKGDGITDDTESFKLWIDYIKNNNITECIIPAKKFYITDTLKFNNINNLNIYSFGEFHFKPFDSVKEALFFVDCNDIYCENIKITTERTASESAPQDHNRKNLFGSNIRGFFLAGVSNFEINGLECKNTSYDVFVACSSSAGHDINAIVNKNIKIHNVLSNKSSMPFYVQQVDDFECYDFTINPAKEMGFGDHAFYISKYTNNIKIYNGTINSPDAYFGYLINARYAGTNEYGEDNPNHIYICNVVGNNCGGFYSAKATTISNVLNCTINCINPSECLEYDKEYSDSNGVAFTNDQRAVTEVINCSIYTKGMVFKKNAGNLRFKNCCIEAKSFTSVSFYTSYGTVEFKNSSLILLGGGIYLQNGINLYFDSCNINCGRMYLLSSPYNGNDGKILFKNCDFTTHVNGITQMFNNTVNKNVYLINSNLPKNINISNNGYKPNFNNCTYDYDLSNTITSNCVIPS